MAKYRLTANKTKFYNLAKKFWPDIEPMRRVEFIKYHRVRDYGLIFRAGDYFHRLFLSCAYANVRLGDDWHTYDDGGERVHGWECHTLTFQELMEAGMLEEVKER